MEPAGVFSKPVSAVSWRHGLGAPGSDLFGGSWVDIRVPLRAPFKGIYRDSIKGIGFRADLEVHG